MIVRDCYLILGVAPGAPLEEVRRRYRVLARQYHPDHHPDDPEAVKQFRRLAEAYETIQKFRARSRAASQNLRRPKFTGDDELFEDFFGIAGSQSRLRRSAGADFRYDLEISLAAAVRGVQKVIKVEHICSCRSCQGSGQAPGAGFSTCPSCQGRGRRYGGPGLLRFGPVCPRCRGRGRIATRTCGHCLGQGFTLGEREYCLQIPPGTADGARLRLEGEGGEGFANGPPGNLEVVIHVAPDDFFTLRGNDIHCRVQVSYGEAHLGGFVLVPTLDGYRTVNLPRGTRSGWTCRFPGAGAPGGFGLPPGDQVIEFVVTPPTEFSPMLTEPPASLARLGGEFHPGT
jgi:molecular chaperone DnaJ